MVKRVNTKVKANGLPPLQPAPREFNLRTYAVALAFSALLFIVGILIGGQLSSQVSQEFAQKVDQLQANTRELELMLLLISSNSSDVQKLCPALLQQARVSDNRTTEFGLSLDVLEKSKGRTDSQVQSLKRDYSVMQVRDYLLYKQIAAACSIQLNQIIFFYTNTACPDCVEQGQTLREFKRANPEVLIYTLDVDIGTPVVGALLESYAINSYPALLVNGRVVRGKKTAQELISLLTSS